MSEDYLLFGTVIDQAQAATIAGPWLDLKGMTGASLHARYGTVTGTLTIEMSNFEDDSDPLSVSPPFSALAGVAGKQLVEVGNLQARFLRVRYTHSSGTGLLKVAIHAKKESGENEAGAAPTGVALDATLTGGTQKAIVRGGAKGVTTATDVTSTAEGADHQALDVQLFHGGAAKDPTAVRALTSADVVTAAQGAPVAVASAWPVKHTDGTNVMPAADAAARALFAKITDGTNTMPTGDAVGRALFQKLTDGTNTVTVKAASTAPVAADTAQVVAISPNKGIPAVTTNATYMVTQSTLADITGADITVGAEGRVEGYFTWISTGTPIGRFVFEGKMPDGSTYKELPGSAAGFTDQPTAGAAGAAAMIVTGLRPGSTVRVKYVRTSGGAVSAVNGYTFVS